jgi:ribosomal protein S18 acetylase RimI-like enzyme
MSSMCAARSDPNDVFKLDASHTDEATELLASAFFDYPMWAWVMRDEKHRREALPLAMRASFIWGLILDEAYGIGTPLRGVAIWAPPAMADADVDPDGTRTGWDQVVTAVGEAGMRLYESMIEIQRPLRDQLMPAGAWYLPWLAVDPATQRTGAGTALLHAMWARLDPTGAATYLETENGVNVAYYRQHGFELMHEGVLPPGGPPYYCLLRRPSSGEPRS